MRRESEALRNPYGGARETAGLSAIRFNQCIKIVIQD